MRARASVSHVSPKPERPRCSPPLRTRHLHELVDRSKGHQRLGQVAQELLERRRDSVRRVVADFVELERIEPPCIDLGTDSVQLGLPT